MKDFRDRFIRESNPDTEPTQRPASYIGPSQPPAARPAAEAAPAARPERAERPTRGSRLPVAAGRNRGAAQTVLVNRSLVSVWSEQSFLAERVGTVQQGELLTVLEDADAWLNIRCGTRLSGWVRTPELHAYQDPYAGLGERDDLI